MNGIHLLASNETPSDKTIFTCSLVEKMLFTVCKRFAEDLIRETCADLYTDQGQLGFISDKKNENLKKMSKNDTLKKSGSMTNMTWNSVVIPEQTDSLIHQKFPSYLSVIDVFNTIRRHEKYDFLSNEFMALGKESDTQSRPSTNFHKEKEKPTSIAINNSSNKNFINVNKKVKN